MSYCEYEFVCCCRGQMVQGPDVKGTVPENITQRLALDANTIGRDSSDFF